MTINLTTALPAPATATVGPGLEDIALGAARTEQHHVVEAVLRGVAEWAGRELFYAPVLGGLTNSNWRITVAGKPSRYFMKIPGKGSETYIDRVASHEATRRAGQMGIGPEVVSFDPNTGIETIEFLEGYRALTNGDLKDPAVAHDIISLYKRFNGVERLTATKTVLDMVDEHLAHAETLGVRLPAEFFRIRTEYDVAKRALLASGLDIVPCHNDPMPGNFLVAPQRAMKLVDFEFSSNNERAYELAVMATEMFYDEPMMMECIEDFYGSTSWSVVSRVQVCSALADLKWGLWAVVNAHLTTDWDFDYHKYGLWKLLRCRAKMGDPRWGQWVAGL